MARIVGVDLPKNKRGEIALTYIFGIGKTVAGEILEKANVDKNTKVKDLLIFSLDNIYLDYINLFCHFF
mgnify:CR=1 FL=1